MAQLELVHVAPPEGESARADHEIITHLIDEGARVLDVGCGDGALLRLLARTCKARANGLEINPAKVRACVNRGLMVVQGDAARDLAQFPTAAFDTVIFSRSLMHLDAPRQALKEAGRIGASVIVTSANAGHWRARTRAMFAGRAADAGVGEAGYARPLSIRDMAALARSAGLSISSAVPISKGRAGAPFAKTIWRANWFADEAVFLLSP